MADSCVKLSSHTEGSSEIIKQRPCFRDNIAPLLRILSARTRIYCIIHPRGKPCRKQIFPGYVIMVVFITANRIKLLLHGRTDDMYKTRETADNSDKEQW